ncbi:hypothetical protein F2Q69_00022666 [Brassica cretica]|uniref:Uncharacterized protein n=1 Tax=Brassica cretica TaxID=69181 RepID=A0A8S9Q8Y6_BRACR|nr:hypothetical protein F2Q69_00022666 [Brassica cretica]
MSTTPRTISSGERREAARRRFRSRESDEFRLIIGVDRHQASNIGRQNPKSIDILYCTSTDNTYGINRILQSRKDHDSRGRGVEDDVMKHHVNAIIGDDFWQVVREEKLQEGDFEVESLMSFG